jgi:hypothetical protein
VMCDTFTVRPAPLARTLSKVTVGAQVKIVLAS